MTERSYNGWPASPTLPTRVITPVPGVSFRIVDNPNVATVFTYLVQRYDKDVEPLKGPVADDWGFAYRPDRNNPNALSCHASGTAIDLNATHHPNDTPASRNLTAEQIRTINEILAELDGAVTWGGEPGGKYGWRAGTTSDPMHYEIGVAPGHLRAVAAKIRKAEVVKKADGKPKPAKKAPGPHVTAADKAAAKGERYAKKYHQAKRLSLWQQIRAALKKLGAR